MGGTSGSSLAAWLVEEREEQGCYFEAHYTWRKRKYLRLLDGSWCLILCGIKNGLGSKLHLNRNYFIIYNYRYHLLIVTLQRSMQSS